MSAWMVSRSHIDLLTHALCVTETVSGKTPDEVGKELWRENRRSINYRYDERGRTSSYQFAAPTSTYRDDRAAWVAALHCYRYQACEHPTWKNSQAARWTATLLLALDPYGSIYANSTEYPWGFEKHHIHTS